MTIFLESATWEALLTSFAESSVSWVVGALTVVFAAWGILEGVRERCQRQKRKLQARRKRKQREREEREAERALWREAQTLRYE